VRGRMILGRSYLIFACIIFTLMICSCGNNGGKIEPIKTEVIDFDIQIAKQMIERGEKIIADISVKDTVTREEYYKFLSDMNDAYDGYEDGKWEYMFFYNHEFEDEQIETLHLNKNTFYPTIYHEDVEVVSAQIINSYYQDEYFNTSILVIREEYLGEDSNLKGWHREYLYRKDDEDKWTLWGLRGQRNFLGGVFTSDYLRLKQ
jgi:hypothetical protein